MRTLQHQLQDLADLMIGIDIRPALQPEDFPNDTLRAGWNAIRYLRWEGDRPTHRSKCLAAMEPAMRGYPDGLRLLERIKRVFTSDKEPFRSLEEIAPDLPPVEWLWPGWQAMSMVNVLAAKQGAGKSLVSLDLAGRAMTGSPWPDGAPNTMPPSPVIYVDAESIPQVHNERAEAWGLPRNKLFMLLPDEEDMLVDLGTSKYQEVLAQMVYRLEPALVIIDSLGSVLGKGENAVEDVRGVLGFLAALAQNHRVAVLLIHHLRKALAGQTGVSDTMDPDQIRGSSYITAIGRVITGLSPVQVGPKPDLNGPRKLQVIKSNLECAPAPLGVRFERIGGTKHVRVEYDVRAPKPYEEQNATNLAAHWLLNHLSHGEGMLVRDVIEDGNQAGFSRSALYRARTYLQGKIMSEAGRAPSDARWRLDDEASQRSIISGSCEAGESETLETMKL